MRVILARTYEGLWRHNCQEEPLTNPQLPEIGNADISTDCTAHRGGKGSGFFVRHPLLILTARRSEVIALDLLKRQEKLVSVMIENCSETTWGSGA